MWFILSSNFVCYFSLSHFFTTSFHCLPPSLFLSFFLSLSLYLSPPSLFLSSPSHLMLSGGMMMLFLRIVQKWNPKEK